MFLCHHKVCYMPSARFQKVMIYWSLLIRQTCLLINMQTQNPKQSEHHNAFYTARFFTPVFYKWLPLQSKFKYIHLYSVQHPTNHFGGCPLKIPCQLWSLAFPVLFLPDLFSKGNMIVSLHCALLQGIGKFSFPSLPECKPLQNRQYLASRFQKWNSASLLLGKPAQKTIKNELKLLNDMHNLESKRIKVNITPQHWVSLCIH